MLSANTSPHVCDVIFEKTFLWRTNSLKLLLMVSCTSRNCGTFGCNRSSHCAFCSEQWQCEILLQIKVLGGGSRICRKGHPPRSRDVNSQCSYVSLKLYVKMKELVPLGGARRVRSPLDPPLFTYFPLCDWFRFHPDNYIGLRLCNLIWLKVCWSKSIVYRKLLNKSWFALTCIQFKTDTSRQNYDKKQTTIH